MEGPELTTNAKAAIENFVLLSINHSLGLAELVSSSAGIIVYVALSYRRRLVSLQFEDNREMIEELQFVMSVFFSKIFLRHIPTDEWLLFTTNLRMCLLTGGMI
jgi:hypothetical protein